MINQKPPLIQKTQKTSLLIINRNPNDLISTNPETRKPDQLTVSGRRGGKVWSQQAGRIRLGRGWRSGRQPGKQVKGWRVAAQ